METISAESITSSVNKVMQLVDMITSVVTTNTKSITNFGNSLKNIGVEAIKKFTGAFAGTSLQLVKGAVNTLLDTTASAAKAKAKDLKDDFAAAGATLVSGLCDETLLSNATTAGKNLVQGFANGITNNEYLATNAAREIAKAALDAAKAALDEHSPSREMYKVGDYAGQGFVNALIDSARNSYDAGYTMADSARKGLSGAISKVSDLISNGIDSQPTIRPVLDLSNIESGAGAINGMFGNIGVGANLNAISSSMEARLQNGTNSDVVSAIDKLRNDLGNIGGTTNNYNVNGVTYDDGSNITDAVRTIVRAATVERRT